jgi:hypothetical protein
MKKILNLVIMVLLLNSYFLNCISPVIDPKEIDLKPLQKCGALVFSLIALPTSIKYFHEAYKEWKSEKKQRESIEFLKANPDIIPLISIRMSETIAESLARAKRKCLLKGLVYSSVGIGLLHYALSE